MLARLHRDKEAVDSYRRAIAAKQDYWPAYARWAELLQNRGNIAQARSVVGEGMKHSPESKTLNALQAELGVAEKKSKAAGKAKAESTDAAESKSEGEK